MSPLDALTKMLDNGVEYPDAIWKVSQDFNLTNVEVEELELLESMNLQFKD